MGLNYTAVDQDSETTLTRARGGQCWVVEQDGRLIGSLTMSMPPSDGLQELTPEARKPGRAWLNQVAVFPAARGLGIASDLWRRGRQWALSQQATSIGVDTAIPAEHLVQLYRAWGFAQVGSIHWEGKTYDSFVMTRLLGPEDARST
jgi:GNAT superfamily N-acetyltransferase